MPRKSADTLMDQFAKEIRETGPRSKRAEEILKEAIKEDLQLYKDMKTLQDLVCEYNCTDDTRRYYKESKHGH